MKSISKLPRLIPPAVMLGMALSLAACGKQAPAPKVVALPPLSAELQATYDRSCKSCHSIPGTGAPLAGDAAAWAPRLQQGREVLLDHSINGYRSMPPLGACMDCTENEMLPLIEYMAGTKL